MPSPYHINHWPIFCAIPHNMAGPIGFVPSRWAAQRGLMGIPMADSLPQVRLTRTQVRDICQDPDKHVLFGYVCAMAWGSQGAGPGGAGHVTAAWGARPMIAAHLNRLRAGGMSRSDAYNLFLGAGNVPGLGPSYWTKLLYFFNPTPDFYIMDQWTGKSINLLTGNCVVRMSGHAPSPNLNKCGNYQAFCEEVDEIAGLLGQRGDDVEEMLMSKGGRHPWPWRAHVRANPAAHAYNRNSMIATYPHIPAAHI